MMQQTNFPFEVIIHDDASTDNTATIIREYAQKDSRIIPILRKTNIKSTGVPVFPITFQKSKGKYIAMCEGDDYWTDPFKLRKQVDFLEINKKIVASFTDGLVKNEILKKEYQFVKNLSEGVATKYLPQYLNWFVFLEKVKKSADPLADFAKAVMENSNVIKSYREIENNYLKLNVPHYLKT